jgi:hypothetical protein
MNTISCAARGFHLFESRGLIAGHPHRPFPVALAAGLSGALFLWATCCASDSGGKSAPAATPGLPDELRLNLGTIAISEDNQPAAYGFQTGAGVVETAGERSGRYAGATINKATGTPEGDLMLSPVTFIATPFAALVGAVSPDRKMETAKMTSAQLDLTAALERACRQEAFRAEVIRAAKETGGRELVGMGQARGDPGRIDTVFHTRIDQVSLERLGKSEKSFALKIKTRNRLVRASDGKVIYERPIEYCSGADLFVEWTRSAAIESVMKTGMRKIARDIATEMLSLYDSPVVAGTAKSPAGPSSKQPIPPLKLAGLTREAMPRLVPVADTGSDALGIFATSHVARVSVQHIADEQPELPVSVEQTESALDGMTQHPNYGVSLPAIAVAVPLSIGNQLVEVIKRVSPAKAREAGSNLSRAAREDRLDEEVAFEVAQQLAPQTGQPVVFVKGSLPSPGDSDRLVPNPDSPRMQFVSHRPKATRLAGTAIYVRITQAALTGKGELNPRLCLCIRGEADLVRLSDGEKLCSFPMEFKGATHRYTQWAAGDAELFRKELKRGYRELGKALADRLVSRGIVPPEGAGSSFLATN